MGMTVRTLAGTGLLGAGLAALAYPLLLRRWCLTWGATEEEAARALPGDDLLPDADLVATRAVGVDAPPSAIWPWLVQMGSGRGGAYTYDWIENLFGLDMHSADEILPQFQDLKVGDALPMGGSGPTMIAEIVEPERVLTFRSGEGDWVWTFVLVPEGDTTRLISRNRISASGATPFDRLVNLLIMEPGSLVMERKMLLGIKSRAERRSHAVERPRRIPAGEPAEKN
ncbi:hypothetical protein ACFFMN_07275 [Planobispora siamensis]|uniref:SRPBCC family protein n=2 Tax=Planobispora siamensis TaxID=936338 RepID=A0A8J3WLM6_9ACTN|nr:hypothetical protein Psi01_60940 [Planobispora siamensis]